MLSFVISSKDIKDDIFIPKYYDTVLRNEILSLKDTKRLYVLGDLIDKGIIEAKTGDEIGKMAYGTGDIPFVRTSDISNWEIKAVPKQGVSKEIYDQYAEKQDVRPNDILMVRDGSYLIGVTCMIHEMDLPLLYQSHILKFRVVDNSVISPEELFLALNSPLVQRQIRSFQFTADIIDTIGNRYREIVLPLPSEEKSSNYCSTLLSQQATRVSNRMLIKQFPKLIEEALLDESMDPFVEFESLTFEEAKATLVADTSALEFGGSATFTMPSSDIIDNIFIPKYYDPSISDDLSQLADVCVIKSISDLVAEGTIELSTGDEIGKMAYGTGDIPFIRTTDFSNWELKYNVKQCVSRDIYERYRESEDVADGDILLVRDGSYLIGSTCLLTSEDTEILFCGGLIKIRSLDYDYLDANLLMALLNSYIVKRQIRSKQFTRDIIDTLGNRFPEVLLPIPRKESLRNEIANKVQEIITQRIAAREAIKHLAIHY